MIDEDLVDALTTDLIAALGRQRVAEDLERQAALALAEAEEAIEDTPGAERALVEEARAARDKAERVWLEAQGRLREAREDREAIEAELQAMDPVAVRGAYLRHSRAGAAGDW